MGTLDEFFDDLKEIKETVKPKPVKSVAKRKKKPSNVHHEELSDIDDSLCPVCAQPLKELTHAVVNIKFASETTLEESKEAITFDQGFNISPYPQKYSSFGGSYGGGSIILKEDMANLFPMLMDWRRDHFDRPFVETLEDAYRFSNLKPEHMFINVSEGTVKWIESNTDRSWMDFLKEWNAIDVMAVPDGYVELVDREHELEAQFEKAEEEVRHALSGFTSYSREKRFDLDNPDDVGKGIRALKEAEDLLPIRIRLKNQLEDVKEEIEELLEGE